MLGKDIAAWQPVTRGAVPRQLCEEGDSVARRARQTYYDRTVGRVQFLMGLHPPVSVYVSGSTESEGGDACGAEALLARYHEEAHGLYKGRRMVPLPVPVDVRRPIGGGGGGVRRSGAAQLAVASHATMFAHWWPDQTKRIKTLRAAERECEPATAVHLAGYGVRRLRPLVIAALQPRPPPPVAVAVSAEAPPQRVLILSPQWPEVLLRAQASFEGFMYRVARLVREFGGGAGGWKLAVPLVPWAAAWARPRVWRQWSVVAAGCGAGVHLRWLPIDLERVCGGRLLSVFEQAAPAYGYHLEAPDGTPDAPAAEGVALPASSQYVADHFVAEGAGWEATLAARLAELAERPPGAADARLTMTAAASLQLPNGSDANELAGGTTGLCRSPRRRGVQTASERLPVRSWRKVASRRERSPGEEGVLYRAVKR